MALRHPSLLDAADALLEGGGGANVEFTLPGTVAREFIGRLLPLAGPVGGDAAAMLALYDLTLAKRTEQMRADFIANVSHELRTPLASLTGFVETLQGAARDDAEARERFLAIMHEQAARMGRLVEDLLSLSRIELSESLPLEQRVDLNRLLAYLAAAMEPQAKARDMAVTLAEEVAPVEVTGDADQLSQVFQNLLDNALKYGREGTSVDIRVTRRNGEADRPTPAGTVAVAVTDHGQGIARKHLPRLTERFYRVDARARAPLAAPDSGSPSSSTRSTATAASSSSIVPRVRQHLYGRPPLGAARGVIKESRTRFSLPWRRPSGAIPGETISVNSRTVVLVALFAALLAGPAAARDQIRIVGSSTLYPFVTAVAEQFGKTSRFKTPIVESTGTGGGLKLFCGGVGVRHADIANASRRIKRSEVAACAKRGVDAITELQIGFDGIVLATPGQRHSSR